MTTSNPRIAPMAPPYAPEIEASLRKWMPKGSAVEPLALFRTIARFPHLDDRLRYLGSGFLGHGTLSLRLRELAILRTCARCGAEYEWGVHVTAFGPEAGLNEHAIHATVEAGPADVASRDQNVVDALVLRAVDELHDTGTLTDATWTALAGHFNERTLVELVALVGFYHLISFVVNALGVQHEPWAARFPAASSQGRQDERGRQEGRQGPQGRRPRDDFAMMIERDRPPGEIRGIAIREARADERRRLGELMVAVYAALEGFPGPAEQPAYYELLANIGDLAALPGTQLLVAVADARLLGGVVYFSDMAHYGAGGTAKEEKETSAFRLLAVDPEARGLGIGKALVMACLERARARQHRQVVIHTTHAMTVAWRMYEELGFARAPELDFLQAQLPVYGFRRKL